MRFSRKNNVSQLLTNEGSVGSLPLAILGINDRSEYYKKQKTSLPLDERTDLDVRRKACPYEPPGRVLLIQTFCMEQLPTERFLMPRKELMKTHGAQYPTYMYMYNVGIREGFGGLLL